MSAQPVEINAEFAALFTMSKQQLLDHGAEGQIFQTGAAYAPGNHELPNADHLAATLCTSGETLIETFMVPPAGDAEPTGSDADLIELWRPSVSTFVTRIRQMCADLGIRQSGVAYLTTSITPATEVIGLPHFDDGQFNPNEGVGLVAIVGDIAGSRVATEPVPHRSAKPGLPVELGEETIDRFFAGHIGQQHSEPNRIVVFPQFAQLHSGPQIIDGDDRQVRCMLVYRSGT